MKRLLLGGALSILHVAMPALAQMGSSSATRLVPGARVQLSSTEPGAADLDAKVVARSGDTLVVTRHAGPQWATDPMTILRPTITRLSVGVRAGRGAGIAGIYGAAIGGAALGLLAGQCLSGSVDEGRALCVLGTAVVTGVGILVGGLIGALIGRANDYSWVPVDTRTPW